MESKLNPSDSSIDIIGLGKTAKAIPTEVYVETTRGLIEAFNKIISPLTETTSDIGRYIRQKFDNMVDIEKAIGAFSVQKAVEKAQKKNGIREPKHLKSFIKSFEEASKETYPILHEMWVNILANQITDSSFHPRYVNILSSFSSDEANLLLKLNTRENIGKDFSVYFGSPRDGFNHFVVKNPDNNLFEWSYSCNVLLEFELAEVIAPNEGIYKEEDNVTILYLTKSGQRFLEIVTME